MLLKILGVKSVRTLYSKLTVFYFYHDFFIQKATNENELRILTGKKHPNIKLQRLQKIRI